MPGVIPVRLQEYLYNRKLRKFTSTNLRDIPADHFSNLTSAGIIFSAEPEAELPPIKRFSRSLGANGMHVSELGYFEDNKDPGQQNFPYITSRTLSIAMVSKSDIARQFVERPFDILFNLDYRGFPALGYIAAASKAYFKVGPATASARHHDLLIDLNGEYSTAGLLSEIRRILTLTN